MNRSMGETREEPRYGIGQQDFRILRLRDCVYVDKTEFIRKIVESGTQYYFLARPRRFGKSLFLSTLRYFFEGKRELFEGLDVDSLDWDWAEYPVLHLDFNRNRYTEVGSLRTVLNTMFGEWESRYGVEHVEEDLSVRFRKIIEAAHAMTGREVVILVDEYDKALVSNLHKREVFERHREELASIYTNFKGAAEHIRLVFITGVSRFGRLSVFSDLNNIQDITFSEDFSDVCGITEKELYTNFRSGIEKMSRVQGWDYESTCLELKRNYDGYRFTPFGSDIYNPWSLLNAMSQSAIGNYWNETGMPTLLVESLKRVNADLESLFDSYCTPDDLKGFDLLDPKPLPLLYQTGYITIKDYNRKLRKVRLGIPNREVKEGFYKMLLPCYVDVRTSTPRETLERISDSFILGNPESAMKSLQSYFAGIDYKLRMDNENNFHNAFFLLIDLLGLTTRAEAHTSDGSIDIVVKTDDYIYIIELKYDHTAQEALRQIEEKRYARPYLNDPREVICIGAAFSSQTRCIEDWIICNLSEKPLFL